MIKKLNTNFVGGSPYPPSSHNAFVDCSASFSDSFGADHDTDKHNNLRIAHGVAVFSGGVMVYSEYVDSITVFASNVWGISLNPAIRMRSKNHWGVIVTPHSNTATFCEQPENRTDLYTTIKGSNNWPFTVHIFGERI